MRSIVPEGDQVSKFRVSFDESSLSGIPAAGCENQIYKSAIRIPAEVRSPGDVLRVRRRITLGRANNQVLRASSGTRSCIGHPQCIPR